MKNAIVWQSTAGLRLGRSLVSRPRMFCVRYASRHDFEPYTEAQSKAVKQYQKFVNYSEEYAHLKPKRSPFFEWLRSVMPMNAIADMDWSFENIKAIINAKRRQIEIQSQRFNKDRFETLGFDIGTAHMVIFQKGAVKFKDQDTWLRWTTERKYKNVVGLPLEFQNDVYVEGIDLSNVRVYYEALENFAFLRKLNYLSLENSELVDDWFLDVISNLTTLEYLNVSHCPKISYRGIACLYKLTNLKVLKLYNDKARDDTEFQLACINLLNFRPDLQIDLDPVEKMFQSGKC